MKYAGTARTLLLAAIGVLMLALGAGTAAADVTPLRANISSTSEWAGDGSDIYWISDRELKPIPKDGYATESRLMRTSLLDGSKTLIKLFDRKNSLAGYPDHVRAGGGYAYVTMAGDGRDKDGLGSSSSVIRFSRDGSSVQTVATGVKDSAEEDDIIVSRKNGKRRGILNDCGTQVSADFVTVDGSVVINETTSDRESKRCGRKKNVDHVRFYLLSPTGAVREILREDLDMKLIIRFGKRGSWSAETRSKQSSTEVTDVVGDRALLSRGSKGSFSVRDITTGAETGPYSAGLPGDLLFAFGMLDPDGRVALNSYSVGGSKKKRKFKYSTGVVQTPGDPASFKRMRGFGFLMYCGTRLIAENRKGIRELDPVTYNVIRPIAPLPKGDSSIDADQPCNKDYVYVNAWHKGGTAFRAYPLG